MIANSTQESTPSKQIGFTTDAPPTTKPGKGKNVGRKTLTEEELARIRRAEQFQAEQNRYKSELANLEQALSGDLNETILNTKKKAKKKTNFSKLSSTVSRIKQVQLDQNTDLQRTIQKVRLD